MLRVTGENKEEELISKAGVARNFHDRSHAQVTYTGHLPHRGFIGALPASPGLRG